MGAGQQPPPIDAKRFAALMAGFDLGNPNEAEAMGKGRALRRMVAACGLRMVDVMEMPDVREALDAQMQPLRQALPDGPALQAARAEVEELREKLAAVVPKLREVAEALAREKELTARLRGQAPAAAANQGHGNALPVAPGGWLGFLAALAAAGLVIASALR